MLGITDVRYVRGQHSLAIVDRRLSNPLNDPVHDQAWKETEDAEEKCVGCGSGYAGADGSVAGISEVERQGE